jgi:hypothetical protein
MTASSAGQSGNRPTAKPRPHRRPCSRCARVKTLIVVAALDGIITPTLAARLIRWGGLRHE